VIDVSGGRDGGAARWRREAQAWTERRGDGSVVLVGADKHVVPSWLLRREWLPGRRRRISANNVSFVTGSGPKIVVLQNALHFLRPGESQRLAAMPPGFWRQVPVVRAAARRADAVVVPCSEMAERVTTALPGLASRLLVRHHPLTAQPARSTSGALPFVLYPSLPAPHKDLTGHLRLLIQAMEMSSPHLVVKVTAPSAVLGPLAGDPRVEAIGPKTLEEIDVLASRASAIYAPTVIESFGYPVAEARAIGAPVLAVSTARNREVGGQALVGFAERDVLSLANALTSLPRVSVVADPGPFDPDAYFSWLTAL
jgi:glycosyltransferase involved in cell wall biosynthesis